MLQPLDVCFNRFFKDYLCTMWQQWMFSGQAKLTKEGNLMKPDISVVARWVKDA